MQKSSSLLHHLVMCDEPAQSRRYSRWTSYKRLDPQLDLDRRWIDPVEYMKGNCILDLDLLSFEDQYSISYFAKLALVLACITYHIDLPH